MKKIYYLLFLFSFLLIKVNALEIDLKNPFIKFPKEGEYVLQGFTTVEDKLFTIFINPMEDKPIIKIFKIDDGSLVKSFSIQALGHANDVTYNNNEKKIYVVNGNGEKIVHVLDGETYKYLETKTINLPIRSMTYVSDRDLYAVRTVSVGYFLDNKFVATSNLPFIVGMNFRQDVARQGWAYNDGMLYYSTWSWIRFGGNGTNTIYVYTVDGDTVGRITTKAGIGELENVSFYEDQMILGINTYDDFIEFYKIKKPVIEPEERLENTIEEEPKKESFNYLPIIIGVSLVVVIACFIVIKKRCM